MSGCTTKVQQLRTTQLCTIITPLSLGIATATPGFYLHCASYIATILQAHCASFSLLRQCVFL